MKFAQALVLVLAVACSGSSLENTGELLVYRSIHYGLSGQYPQTIYRRLSSVLDSLDAQPAEVAGVALDSFLFCLGDSRETLDSYTRPDQWDSLVLLPHRVLRPNTALWYKKKILSRNGTWLAISSDDGAQVFLGEERLQAGPGGLFMIYAGKDSVDLVIRVLNNAMAGGLKGVKLVDVKAHDEFFTARAINARLKQKLKKISTQGAPAEMLESTLSSLGSSHAPSAEAKQVLSCPWFLIPPYLVDKGDRVVVRWECQACVSAKIHLDLESTTHTYKVPGNQGFFEYELPRSVLSYKVCLDDRVCTEQLTLKMTEKDTFSFSAWADSQGGWPVFREVNRLMNAENISFSVGVGDLVGQGDNDTEWRALLDAIYPYGAQKIYYLMAGNHDYDGYYDDLVSRNYQRFAGRNDTLSYFSWNYGNAAFIALDPNRSFPISIKQDREQSRWLSQVIHSKQWEDATWRFIFVHQPPYSQGWPGYHGDETIREVIDPLVHKGVVDFVVSGHTHDYEHLLKRSGDFTTDLLIIGGAGGSLEPLENSNYPEMDTIVNQHHYVTFTIEGNTCRMTAKNLKGEIMHEFKRKKRL